MFGFRLSSDQRYVVSVSNKIITFDVTTGDMSRVVYPANVEGLMMDMDIRSIDINLGSSSAFIKLYLQSIQQARGSLHKQQPDNHPGLSDE